jgi:vacuolar-type H+-ATPase subunit I/STV1
MRQCPLQSLNNILVSRACAYIFFFHKQIKREKAVYHTLNKLSVDVTRKVLVGEAWVPASSRVRVQEAVRQVSENSNSSVRAFTSLLRQLLCRSSWSQIEL